MDTVIYKITNTASGKSYVGRTKNLVKRIREHKGNRSYCRYLSNAIKKYGWSLFKINVLETCEYNDAPERELWHIQNEKTLVPFGYNLVTETNQGRILHKETLEKMSRFHQGRKASGKFVGVSDRKNCYEARIGFNKKTYSGRFQTEQEAAEAYDILAINFFGRRAKLNFVESLDLSDKEISEKLKNILHKRSVSSQYKGVGFHKLTKKWRAYKYEGRKQINLGVFPTELEAYRATLQD